MEGLKEIGQEIGKLFVDAIENQSKLQSERDDMNYLRYRNMIVEELKSHSENVDRQVKNLEKRFLELNIKGANEALGGKKRIDTEVFFQNMKSPVYCKQSFNKDDIVRLAIQIGSNSIKLTIDGEQERSKGGDNEAFIKVCSDTKNFKKESSLKSPNHNVGLTKYTLGPCGKCRAMGHIRKQCPRIAKRTAYEV